MVEGAGLESSYWVKLVVGSNPTYSAIFPSRKMVPTSEERARRSEVIARVLRSIEENRTVKLPDFDASRERPSDRFALVNVGLEPNDFSGTLGPFRYQFEGEEDLLHLLVLRPGGVSPEEGRRVAAFVLDGVSPALIFMRQGEESQHFYVGHDELVGTVTP